MFTHQYFSISRYLESAAGLLEVKYFYQNKSVISDIFQLIEMMLTVQQMTRISDAGWGGGRCGGEVASLHPLHSPQTPVSPPPPTSSCQ